LATEAFSAPPDYQSPLGVETDLAYPADRRAHIPFVQDHVREATAAIGSCAAGNGGDRFASKSFMPGSARGQNLRLTSLR